MNQTTRIYRSPSTKESVQNDVSRGGTQEATTEKQRYAVYTIVENASGGDDFWQRIGIGFQNKDGSVNVILNALPVNGTLHIRVDEPREGAE